MQIDLSTVADFKDRRVFIKFQNAEEFFDALMVHIVDTYERLPEYNQVIDWLKDNKGKGLLLYGDYGRGKTIIARRLLSYVMTSMGKILSYYTATEANMNPTEVLSRHIVCIDDFGTEGESNIYGNRRMVLSELLDAAEQDGKLLILTTNLTPDQIITKYGGRTFERLIAVTRRVEFKGNSLRI